MIGHWLESLELSTQLAQFDPLDVMKVDFGKPENSLRGDEGKSQIVTKIICNPSGFHAMRFRKLLQVEWEEIWNILKVPFREMNACIFFRFSEANLGWIASTKVQIPEARAFYGFQIAMENIHSETST